MAVAVTASVLRTCLGDGAATFAALLAGESGCRRLPEPVTRQVGVGWGYPLADPDPTYRASRWLSAALTQVVRDAGLDFRRERVDCIVGTGLGETATLEAYADRLGELPRADLGFDAVVRRALPGVRSVVTLSNACAAAGHALAVAQDLLEADEADAVVVAGVDAMSLSMLAMIGRAGDPATDQVRPFDVDRTGVLLGEGVGAVVLRTTDGPALGRLLGTGLSCDAFHETAPSSAGITRAVEDAYARSGRTPDEVGLLVTHGTGTALNDPTEATAMHALYAAHGASPLVTAVKGAIGHLSGGAALANLDVALRCLAAGQVPPVVGLREPIDEAAELRLVRGRPADWDGGLIQLNAFGFGGVNAVSLVAGPS